MSSAVIAENYSAAKLKEYICFVEQLGSNIHFHENKWVCSNLRRSPAERSCMFTLYFDRIPALHRETVKSFAAISLIRGKKISTVKSYVMDLIRFFDFWSLDKGTLPLSGCDEFAVADFYHYLEKTEFAEATRIGIWSSLSIFFETMNDIDGARSKNPFSVSPYRHQRRYDAKYIPESIAIQLDTAFKNDEIALYLLQKETITGDEFMVYVNAENRKLEAPKDEAEASDAEAAPAEDAADKTDENPNPTEGA